MASTRENQKARKALLQALYAMDLENDWSHKRLREALASQDPLLSQDAMQFALELYKQLEIRREAIDTYLENCSPKWKLERLGIIERSILRMELAELAQKQTPRLVCISEGVRLAELFTAKESVAFIHANLDKAPDSLENESG